MIELSHFTALEQKYDGAVPSSDLRAIRFGGHIQAQIVEYEGQVQFYRDMLLQSVKSSKEWFRRGQLKQAESCRKDGWAYLKGWRANRRTVKGLRECLASRVEEETAREEREANGRSGVGA